MERDKSTNTAVRISSFDIYDTLHSHQAAP